jgi:hypothetical protein
VNPWEAPLIVMDGTLRNYRDLTLEQGGVPPGIGPALQAGGGRVYVAVAQHLAGCGVATLEGNVPTGGEDIGRSIMRSCILEFA